MKRIQHACLEQTIHFQLKDELPHAEAAEIARGELAQYKAQLERSHMRYKIISETAQPDDSIVVKIKKQYNGYSCGEYLD